MIVENIENNNVNNDSTKLKGHVTNSKVSGKQPRECIE